MSLPEEKLNECKQIFNFYDTNNEGSIPTSKLDEIIKSLGVYVSSGDIKDFINQQEGDKVKFDTFIDFFTKFYNTKIEAKDLIEAFTFLDTSGKGFISAAELKHCLTVIGDKLSPEDADSVLEKFIDGGGNVDYKAFSNDLAK